MGSTCPMSGRTYEHRDGPSPDKRESASKWPSDSNCKSSLDFQPAGHLHILHMHLHHYVGQVLKINLSVYLSIWLAQLQSGVCMQCPRGAISRSAKGQTPDWGWGCLGERCCCGVRGHLHRFCCWGSGPIPVPSCLLEQQPQRGLQACLTL